MENEFNRHVSLRVILDSSRQRYIDIPVRPDTICSDIIIQCKQGPNCHLAELWRGCERKIGPDEKIYDILEQWGTHRSDVAFYLRQGHIMPVPHVDGRRQRKGRNGLREEDHDQRLGSGVDLTLTELQEMATRQQRQIDDQQTMMVAKEQRLKFLKQQEVRHQQIANENERLRKLREKVEAQELKLKKLRALRGQVSDQKGTNNILSTELESIRALFNDKEKELVMAVTRVEDLTNQLDQLRRGRINGLQQDPQHSVALTELNKLRKELVIRNKLNEQQNSKLVAHRDILSQRREEMSSMDQRIAELQQRLRTKKHMQEEANRNHSNNILSNQGNQVKNGWTSGNVATVEPYRFNEETTLSKKDPKYQSLPYNVKFPVANKDVNQGQISTGLPVNKGTKTVLVSSSGTPVQSQGSPSILYAAGESPGNPQTSTPVVLSAPHGKAPASSTTYPSTPLTTKPRPLINTAPNREIFITGAPTTGPTQTSPQQREDKGQPVTHGEIMEQGHIRQGSDDSRSQRSEGTLSQNTSRQVAGDASLHGNKPYRYASRDVIANTYTGKLTSDAMDQYRKNMSQLYKDMSDSESGPHADQTGAPTSSPRTDQTDAPTSSPMAKVKPVDNTVVQSSQEKSRDSAITMDTPKVDSLDGSGLSSGVYNIDPERTRLHGNKQQPHAPRPLRRRHSSGGDTPEGCLRNKANSEVSEKYPQNNNVGSVEGTPEKQYKVSDGNGDMNNRTKTINPPDLIRVDLIQKDIDSDGEESDGKELPPTGVNVVGQQQNVDDDIPFADDDSDVIEPVTRSTVTRGNMPVVLRRRKGNLKSADYVRSSRRVSFDPLALLLDAALEGELDLVVKSAHEVADPSCPNDEGITALHNAICAGHSEIVKFLVEYGCNVNSPDSDGWTPLHCAASCNNLGMVRTLVEHGACIFAETISDHETAAEKCEEDEEGYHGCSQYLYSIQEKLGIANKGVIYAVFDYEGQGNDELTFTNGDGLTVVRKGDEKEREWWWAERNGKQGYIPRNLMGMFPRVVPKWLSHDDTQK